MKLFYKLVCKIRGRHKIDSVTDSCKCGYTRSYRKEEHSMDDYYLKER